MITKDEGSFERDRDYGTESNRPFSMDDSDSPPTYDDPNYIPSPVSMSGGGGNMTAFMPLFVPRATSAAGGWDHAGAGTGSSSVVTSSSSETEPDWTHTLHELEQTMAKLQAARTRTRAAQPKQFSSSSASGTAAREVRALEGQVLRGMRRLALVHPDMRVREVWNARAEVFVCGMSGMSGYRGPMPEDGGDGFDGSAPDALGPHNVDGRVYREESYANSDADFIMDQQRPSKSNKRSLSSLSASTSTLSTKARNLLASDDKGLSYIKRGTAGVVIAPIAMSGALLYGTAALLYGAGKGAVYLGRRVVGGAGAVARGGSASESRGGEGEGEGVSGAGAGADPRSTSNPELVPPSHARSTLKGEVRYNRDF